MKKIILVILMFLLIIFFCPSAVLGEYKLKYDFQYLFNWVAGKMEIAIDPKKPQPKLKILPQEEVQRLYKEKNGKLILEIEENGIKIKIKISGFYQRHPENTIYTKDEADLKRGETLEEIIVHELVHYFQNYYHLSQDFTCLEDFFPYKGCPRQREACKWEKLFRLEHGLTIIDLDLECLFNP